MVEYQQKYLIKKGLEMMRYIPTDKYTVAWFKLAECVAKGEKEKAFGVYRLLMHSLEDKAYAHQLEGDLLGAFQDDRALEKYEHAAQMYTSNNRWKEAIALYEELVIMCPENARAMQCLLELYTKYKKPEQYASKIIKLAYLFFSKKNFVYASQLIDMLPECAVPQETVQACISLCMQVIKKNELEAYQIEKLLEKTLSYVMNETQINLLATFLSDLEQINAHWFYTAQNYMSHSATK
jgi:tetratricopeptide (TPR) repeat protein